MLTNQQTSGLPWERACRFCHAPIDRHEAARSGVCSGPACRARQIRETSDEVIDRRWQAHVEQWKAHIVALCQIIEAHGPELDAAAADLGGHPADIAYGLVPRLDRHVAALPAERRAEFATRLDELVTLAFTETAREAPTERREAQLEHPLMSSACATCAGRCCTLGAASHAFLSVETIHRFRETNPGSTGADVIAHYLGQIPAHSVEGSCVYHGEEGCALPRSERSDVCNDYHCGPQTQLGRRYDQMGATKALIVACDGTAAPAIGLHRAEQGWHRFPANDAPRAASAQHSGSTIKSAAVAGTVEAALSLHPPAIG